MFKSRLLVLLATFPLAACPVTDKLGEAGPSSGGSQPVAEQEADLRLTKGCELKNPLGTGTCEDGRSHIKVPGKQSSEASAPKVDSAKRKRDEAACDERKYDISLEDYSRFIDLLAEDRVDEAFAYCASAPVEKAAASEPSEPAPVFEEPAASSAPQTGGGCEWKGRNYSPGESIYHTEGPIYSSDLFVFGENFGNLSGKSGPWQQCECQVSVGHWGCV